LQFRIFPKELHDIKIATASYKVRIVRYNVTISCYKVRIVLFSSKHWNLWLAVARLYHSILSEKEAVAMSVSW